MIIIIINKVIIVVVVVVVIIINISFLYNSVIQLWHDLCDLICKHPTKVTSLKVDPIIRGGIKRFSDERGKLWCSLADYYIRSGHFEKVSDLLTLRLPS